MTEGLPLDGVRVVEVASWLMVPATAGILADWGAEVIKIEPPRHGDPLRGLNSGGAASGSQPLNYAMQHTNRGKKSVAVDIATDEGHDVLRRLVRRADVFVTNFLPSVRRRLRIDDKDILAINPSIVYARGSAVGPRGAEREKGGYDYATFWCRSGIAHAFHQHGQPYPPAQNGGFGDGTTAATFAGGIAAGLFRRERTGRGTVVDSSLLAMGMWVMGIDITNSLYHEEYQSAARADRLAVPNPLVNIFRTGDDRYIALVLLQADRNWPELCHRVGRPDLRDDPRFATSEARMQNRRACIEILDSIFAARTLAEWKAVLHGTEAVWDVVQSPLEVAEDPQAVANDYLMTVGDGETGGGGAPLRLVASPVQFDEGSCAPGRAPSHGEHTEEILLDLGFSWEDIGSLKEAAVIL